MTYVIREKVTGATGESTEIFVEIPVETTEVRASPSETRGGASLRDPFKKSLELIRACASEVAETALSLGEIAKPSEMTLEFGIKFSGEVGAIISKSSLEAGMQVTLTWKGRTDDKP